MTTVPGTAWCNNQGKSCPSCPAGPQTLEAKLLFLISEVRNLPELCQERIKFQSVCWTMPVFFMNFQGRQSTVRTHSKLWTFIASKVTEITQRIAILTSFHQSQLLDMKCNWQDERISDKFRDCQERQWNKCQISAYCSTVLLSVPRVFPGTAIPLAQSSSYHSTSGSIMCSYCKTS